MIKGAIQCCVIALSVVTSYASQLEIGDWIARQRFGANGGSVDVHGRRANRQFSTKYVNDLPIPYEEVPENCLINSPIVLRYISDCYNRAQLKDVTIYNLLQARYAAEIFENTAMEAERLPIGLASFDNIGHKQRVADVVTNGLYALADKLTERDRDMVLHDMTIAQGLYTNTTMEAGQKPNERRLEIIHMACNMYLHQLGQIASAMSTFASLTSIQMSCITILRQIGNAEAAAGALEPPIPSSFDWPVNIQVIADRNDLSTAAKILYNKWQTIEEAARDIDEFRRWRRYNGTAHHMEFAEAVARDIENVAVAFESTSRYNQDVVDSLRSDFGAVSELARLYELPSNGVLDGIWCAIKNCVTTVRLKTVMSNALRLMDQLEEVT
jgi:hypothetical protein